MKKILFVFLLTASFLFADTPYHREFQKVRPVNVSNSAGLADALATAQTGDEISMADGTYTGDFKIAHADVKVQCLGHCTVNGHFDLTGDNTWLVGVDVYSNVSGTGLINATAPRTMVINNYAHSDGVTENMVCYFTSENGYPDQVAYGNIFSKCEHNTYIQHDAAQGTEYYIANYTSLPLLNGNGRNLHAYTQSPHKLERFVFEKNIFERGEVLLGGLGSSTIPIYNRFKDNIFYAANLNLGYQRPNTTSVIDNWFLNSILLHQNFYGTGAGVQPPADDPAVVTGNHFFNAGLKYGWDHFRFTTAAYNAAGAKLTGSPKIRTVDTWDNNYYHVMDFLRAPFNAGGVNTYLRSLAEWQNASAAAGKKFDANATVTQGAPNPSYRLIPNEFDSSRALLAVYAFNGAASVPVDFPKKAELRSVSDPYGAVVAAGAGTLDVPLAGAEFAAFVVTYAKCDLNEIERKRKEVEALRIQIINILNLMENKLQEQKELIDGCQQ